MAKKRKQVVQPEVAVEAIETEEENVVDSGDDDDDVIIDEIISSEEEDEDEGDNNDDEQQQPKPPVTLIPLPTAIKSSIASSDGRYHNKQRLLVLSSRGITARYRHLLEDLRTLIPHSKKESKLDVGKFA
jgi:ribosome biogenesis protein BRX1